MPDTLEKKNTGDIQKVETLDEKIERLEKEIEIGNDKLLNLDQKINLTETKIKEINIKTTEVTNQIKLKENNIETIKIKIIEIENNLKILLEEEEKEKINQEGKIKITEKPLSEEQIKKNKEEIDSTLSEEEKGKLAVQTGEEKYNDKTREALLEEITEEEKGEGEGENEKDIKKDIGEKITRNFFEKYIFSKFKKKLFILGGAGLITFLSSGFSKDKDGGIFYDYKSLVKPIIETGMKILPEEQKQWATRWCYKQNLYDIPEDTVEYEAAKTLLEKKLKEDKTKAERKEYLKELTYFQKIGEVVDYRASNNEVTRKLMRFRNQWVNENGFEYIAIPNRGNRQGKILTYNNVEGVGHYLLDSDISINQKNNFGDDVNTSDNIYMHPGSEHYIEIAKKNNHYIPVFKRDSLDPNKIILKYKLPNELSSEDEVASPLRQYKFDDLDFSVAGQPIGFRSNVQEVLLKKGIKNPYTGNSRRTNLTFTSGNKKLYGQFSGAGVVFIFKDGEGNVIIRDFSGSINDIQQEGLSIEKEFNLAEGTLTMGTYDLGAYTARPAANKNGVFTTDQDQNFHYGSRTAGGLLIPKQKNEKI